MDKYLDFAQENLEMFLSPLTQFLAPTDDLDAVFMAGSPGAGKTEVALGLAENYSNHMVIDADAFRVQFPDYDGSNSSSFQKASSWLVEQSFKHALQEGYSFILDATFAILSAEKNIKRALKKNYNVSLVYVYQDPKTAWTFTKEREKAEGRLVPKETFINAFFKARENVEKVKERHPQITLHIIIKDYQNNISEVYFDAENIRLILPKIYSRQELEDLLDD